MDFSHKEIDREGMATLAVMSNADNFNEWMYNTIVPYCDGDILEIGSGLGNVSTFFIENKKQIYLSDVRENYINLLQQRFSFKQNRVLHVDIVHPKFMQQYRKLLGRFDSVFSLNVVEHLKDDSLAIQNMVSLLKLGGNLIVLVPAYQFLYNNFDVTLEHYRRYDKQRLKDLMNSHGEIIKATYFNSLGILGWFISGNVFRNRPLPEKEVKLYNLMIPIAKLIDKVTFNRIGLSVICVIRK